MRDRAEIEGELAQLARERGAAALDGRKFDASKIDVLNSELADLDAAQGEQTRRNREAVAEAFARAQAERQSRIWALRTKYLDEVEAAEKAAHELANRLAAARAIATELSGVCHQYTGDTTPTTLSAYEVPQRLSLKLGGLMAGMLGQRFGRIEWRATGSPATGWRDHEESTIERQIVATLNHGGQNGSGSSKN